MNAESYSAELELRRKELEIKLREVELPVELAKLGLWGTLIGAIAGVRCSCCTRGEIGAVSERVHLTGKHICIIMGIVAAAVALYGAFVFQRSVVMTGYWKDKRLAVGTGETTHLPTLQAALLTIR